MNRQKSEVTKSPKVYLRSGENLVYKNQYVSKTKLSTGQRFKSSTLHFINGEPNETKTSWNFTLLPTKDLVAFHESYTFCIKVSSVLTFFFYSWL